MPIVKYASPEGSLTGLVLNYNEDGTADLVTFQKSSAGNVCCDFVKAAKPEEFTAESAPSLDPSQSPKQAPVEAPPAVEAPIVPAAVETPVAAPPAGSKAKT